MTDRQIASSVHVPPSAASNLIRASLAGEALEEAQQVASEQSLQQWTEEAAFNPVFITRRFDTLRNRVSAKKEAETEKAEKEEEEMQVLVVERLEAIADEVEQQNPEMFARALLLLKSKIKPNDRHDDILRKVLEMYPDPSLADEALDFLIATSTGELAVQVKLAKEKLGEMKGREVRAGRNMGPESRKYAGQGLGDPKMLRDLYREVTVNPKEPLVLFDEFTRFFSFEKMKAVLDFLLHSLGADLKAKGPSIPRGELARLLSETRTMQAILHIFRFFKLRSVTMAHRFQVLGLTFPQKLNFEVLSKFFVKLLQEKFPSLDKVKQMGVMMEINQNPEGQMVVFTNMKEGLRQVAPKLFKNEKHKRDLQMLFLQILDELEETLEKEEEQKERKKKREESEQEKKKKKEELELQKMKKK